MKREAPITVAIPSVGRWAALRTCLDSLDAQEGGPPVEAVCLLNGPTGEPPGSLQRSWLRYFRDAQLGVGRARNRALEVAHGDWVLYIDDDCVAPPTWLDQTEAFIRTRPTPEIAIAGGPVTEPQRPGAVYSFMRKLNFMRSGDTLKFRDGIPSLGGANLLVNVAAVRDIGGFNENLISTEDFELVMRAVRNGLGVAHEYFGEAVVHQHKTGLFQFVRRYHSYGQGVRQLADLHDLDRVTYRLYAAASPLALFGAILRFAREDLDWIASHGESVEVSDRVLGLLRAASWQIGSLRARS